MSTGTALVPKGVHYPAPVIAESFGLTIDVKVTPPSLVEGAINYYLPHDFDLGAILGSRLGKEILHPGLDRYERYGWAKAHRAGYQQILLPVPNSHGKTASEQMAFIAALGGGWKPASFLPTLIAYMLYYKQTKKNPLGNDWCRTTDRLGDGNGKYACLAMVGGLIDVAESPPDSAGSGLLMAASQ